MLVAKRYVGGKADISATACGHKPTRFAAGSVFCRALGAGIHDGRDMVTVAFENIHDRLQTGGYGTLVIYGQHTIVHSADNRKGMP